MMNRALRVGMCVLSGMLAAPVWGGDQPPSQPPVQQQQQIQTLANDIFQKMLIDSKGDPQALMKIIADAQKNPAGFVGGLSPEQQAQFKKIAEQMGGSNPTAAAQKEALPPYPTNGPTAVK